MNSCKTDSIVKTIRLLLLRPPSGWRPSMNIYCWSPSAVDATGEWWKEHAKRDRKNERNYHSLPLFSTHFREARAHGRKNSDGTRNDGRVEKDETGQTSDAASSPCRRHSPLAHGGREDCGEWMQERRTESDTERTGNDRWSDEERGWTRTRHVRRKYVSVSSVPRDIFLYTSHFLRLNKKKKNYKKLKKIYI